MWLVGTTSCSLFFWGGHTCSIWSSQARDQIWAAAVAYATAATMPDLLTHCAELGLGIEPVSWCCRSCCTTVGTPVATSWCKNPAVQVGLVTVFYYLFIYFNFNGVIWKFLGQGLNWSCSQGLRQSHNTTRSQLHLQPTQQLGAMLVP